MTKIVSECTIKYVNANYDVERIILGDNPPVLFYQIKLLLRKFSSELFCFYNHKHTYYHCPPYKHISSYIKYLKNCQAVAFLSFLRCLKKLALSFFLSNKIIYFFFVNLCYVSKVLYMINSLIFSSKRISDIDLTG